MAGTMTVAFGFGICLFFLFPLYLTKLMTPLIGSNNIIFNLVDGVIRVMVFLVYIWGILHTTGRIRAAERAGRIVAAILMARDVIAIQTASNRVRVKRHVRNRIHLRIQRNEPPFVGEKRDAITESEASENSRDAYRESLQKEYGANLLAARSHSHQHRNVADAIRNRHREHHNNIQTRHEGDQSDGQRHDEFFKAQGAKSARFSSIQVVAAKPSPARRRSSAATARESSSFAALTSSKLTTSPIPASDCEEASVTKPQFAS